MTDQAPARQNLFGICAAVGEDFGVNPLWLRLGFAFALLFNMEVVIGAYVALGAIVAISRLVAPKPKPIAAQEAPAPAQAAEQDTHALPEWREAA